jgi:hypothetical protein
MHVVDFGRSFVTFRIDAVTPPVTVSHRPLFTVNDARVQLDCRCRIHDRESGRSEDFVLGAACKTERVAPERGLWTEPNADFVPIFSRERFMHLKAYACVGGGLPVRADGPASDRLVVSRDQAFARVSVDVAESDAVALGSAAEVIAAALANAPLVGRTSFEHGGRRAVIEYPIKTINVSERDGHYQADTGPVLHPDLDRPWDELIEGMDLAFVAFNGPAWAEFLLRVPTSLEGGIRVHHYSKVVGRPAGNEIARLAR